MFPAVTQDFDFGGRLGLPIEVEGAGWSVG